MAKIIAISNQKGGVGKTTTAISLGSALSKAGKKVLLVDLDSQANLTSSLGLNPDDLSHTINELMLFTIHTMDNNIDMSLETLNDFIIKGKELDFISSNITLAGIENILVNTFSRENILKNALTVVSSEYDYILIDCMPSLNILTINALVASDSVIIPVQSHFLSLKGLEQLLTTISKVRNQMNKELVIDGILITMYDSRTTFARNVKSTLEENYGEYINIFNNPIPHSVRAVETSAIGKSIQDYEPNGKVATAYNDFAKELMSIG